VLLKKHHLLSAPQILEKLHAKGIFANKTSIYRNLDSFLEDGLICQQSFGNDEFLYELQQDHHDHLQCTYCGKITKTECLLGFKKKIQNFAIEHHHLTLFGRCQQCRKKQ
jgi:Fur family ferric uptake transcriptional regulator